MPTDVLVFESLIPADPGGDPQPCQASFQTAGTTGSSDITVRVMDLGIAMHAASAGGWAQEQLEEALTDGPAKVLLPASAGASLLRDYLTQRGVAPDSADEPVVITDFGALTQGIALNGIHLVDEIPGACAHPGLLQLGDADGRRIAAEAAAAWDAMAAHSGALDPRCYRLTWQPQGGALTLLAMLRELDAMRASNRLAEVEVVFSTQPEDAWVAALGASIRANPEGLGHLSDVWRDISDPHPQASMLRRSADDLHRRALFGWLRAVRGGDESAALVATQEVLGSPSAWSQAFKRTTQMRVPRVVVVPTWQCELRCRYCTIPKQDGRVMSTEVLDGALDLLLSAEAPRYALHFFGGEPFLEWALIQHAIEAGESRAPGRIQYRFTTNGYSLTETQLVFLSKYDVHLQLSLDGDAQTQNSARRSLQRGQDSYDRSPAALAKVIQELGIAHDIIQVIHPSNAHRADENFAHLCELGFERIQLNYALGTRWTMEAQQSLASSLHRLGRWLEQQWSKGREIEVINLAETRMKVRTNREVTVDWDGTVMCSNGFLYVPSKRDNYIIGHLDDDHGFERYLMDGPDDEQLIDWWYRPEITQNNQAVGAVLMSFVRWMNEATAVPAG